MAIEAFHTRTILSAGQVVGLRRQRLRAEVAKGPDKKLRRDFDQDRIVVGTHESCELVLTDPTVSRQHAEIALVDGGYAIRDLGSTNGTFVGAMRVGEVVVNAGVRVRFGDTEVKLAALSDSVEIPLPAKTRFGSLIGKSPAMRRIFDVLEKVSPTDSTVLIVGESGTGKEVAARTIHEASPRSKGPFHVVDCGAMPATLAESVLFGHERGAFTGAVRAQAGAFELASEGTLFLDEIGELPVELQARLLGVLERRQVQRLGSSSTTDVDVRVIAATNRDLRKEINRGGFREDLYFRLAMVSVRMPALRERPEDVPLYVESFLEELGAAESGFTLDRETFDALGKQPWPGNVRELRNVLERAVALGSVDLHGAGADERLASPPTAGDVDAEIPFKVGKAMLIEDYEIAYVTALMRKHENNITQAARAAEIDRVYLLRLLDKYGMRPKRR